MSLAQAQTVRGATSQNTPAPARRPEKSASGCSRRRGRNSAKAARDILALAAARVGRDSFVYVEAEEEGNPRRSFDLNFYKAGLRVADLRVPLSRLCEKYSIPSARLESLLGESAARPFGHLSGGLGREGEDFLTVYYEIEGL